MQNKSATSNSNRKSNQKPKVRTRDKSQVSIWAGMRNAFPFMIGMSLGLALLSLLLLAGILGIYGYYQMSGRILPGIQVPGVKLNNLTTTEAAVLLHKVWNLEQELIITDGIHQQQLTPADLGLSVDPIETAHNAYKIGHAGSLFSDLESIYTLYANKTRVPLVIKFDANKARSELESLAAGMSLPPEEATIQVQGTELVTVPGTFGYTLNIHDTIELMGADPAGIITTGVFQVKLKPVLPRITDISTALAEGQKLLDTPIEMNAYDPVNDEVVHWSVPRETVATWLSVENTEAGPVVQLDESLVAVYLEEIGQTLGSDRWLNGSAIAHQVVESIKSGDTPHIVIKHHATTYFVQPGDTLLKIGWNLGIPFWMILNANPDTDPDALIAGQELTIPSKDELLPYPVVENKRVVISISKQRLWVYKNGELLSKHVISTGMDKSPTQPGVFQVQSHELNAYASVWDLTMPHFLGIYEAWPGFMNGIHGLPTLSSGRRLWASALGQPSSYGCIIMHLDAADWLYHWAEQGVIVEIQP